MKILHDRSPDLDAQSFYDLRLKPRSSDFNLVRACRQGRELVGAIAIGSRDPLHAGSFASRRDPDAGHDCAFLVHNSALKSCGGLGVR
jgi:hypothetical protein